MKIRGGNEPVAGGEFCSAADDAGRDRGFDPGLARRRGDVARPAVRLFGAERNRQNLAATSPLEGAAGRQTVSLVASVPQTRDERARRFLLEIGARLRRATRPPASLWPPSSQMSAPRGASRPSGPLAEPLRRAGHSACSIPRSKRRGGKGPARRCAGRRSRSPHSGADGARRGAAAADRGARASSS